MFVAPPQVTEAELEARLTRFVTASRDAGLKLTAQRLEIFREVARTTRHPNAETVLMGVRARLPTVSLDTVYRTLWTLTEVGLLSTLGPRRDSTRFDGNLTPHHHFVCTECDAAYDFDSPALHRIEIPREARAFGTVSESYVEFTGLCAACAARWPQAESKVTKSLQRDRDGGKRRKRER